MYELLLNNRCSLNACQTTPTSNKYFCIARFDGLAQRLTSLSALVAQSPVEIDTYSGRSLPATTTTVTASAENDAFPSNTTPLATLMPASGLSVYLL